MNIEIAYEMRRQSKRLSGRCSFILFTYTQKKKSKTFELIEKKTFFLFSLNESQPELEMFEIVSTTGEHSSIW